MPTRRAGSTSLAKLFDESMRRWLHDRLQIENELRRALECDRVQLHYQPILEFDSGRVRSVEAFARWAHPTRGLLTAGEFIDVAEQSGVIAPLGLRVVQLAARQLGRWQRELGPQAPDITINLSPRQLTAPIAPILQAAGEQIGHLGVEITEATLIGDDERVTDNLGEFKRHGARLIIDDFGTGYSSLSYLKRLPVDVVKIDATLVARAAGDASERAMVNAIIQFAHALGIAVGAEGVETEQQLTELRQLGCDAAQGHLIAPPRAAEHALPLSG